MTSVYVANFARNGSFSPPKRKKILPKYRCFDTEICNVCGSPVATAFADEGRIRHASVGGGGRRCIARERSLATVWSGLSWRGRVAVVSAESRASTRCRTSRSAAAASATGTRLAASRPRRLRRTRAAPSTSTTPRRAGPSTRGTRRRGRRGRGRWCASVGTTPRAWTASDVCRSTTTDRGLVPRPATLTSVSVRRPLASTLHTVLSYSSYSAQCRRRMNVAAIIDAAASRPFKKLAHVHGRENDKRLLYFGCDFSGPENH